MCVLGIRVVSSVNILLREYFGIPIYQSRGCPAYMLLTVWSVMLRDSWTLLGLLDITWAFLLPRSWLIASFLLGLYSKLTLTGRPSLMTLSEILPSLILRKPASILHSASSVLSLSHIFCICLSVLFTFSTPQEGRFRKGRDFVYYWTPVPRTLPGTEQVLSIYLLDF